MAELRPFVDEAAWLDAAGKTLLEFFNTHPSASSPPRVHVGISGGRTPRIFYQYLRSKKLPTERIEWWIVDERCVPPDSSDRNEAMIRCSLFAQEGLGEIPSLHGWGSLVEPDDAAAAMQVALEQHLPPGRGLDLVFLGIGDDGHTASLFPNSPELLNCSALALATREAHLGWRRVTFGRRLLEQSGRLVFLARGLSKAGMVERVARADASIPAGSLHHSSQTILWLRED
jgi:6-phosphogluconolactonase